MTWQWVAVIAIVVGGILIALNIGAQQTRRQQPLADGDPMENVDKEGTQWQGPG